MMKRSVDPQDEMAVALYERRSCGEYIIAANRFGEDKWTGNKFVYLFFFFSFITCKQTGCVLQNRCETSVLFVCPSNAP